MTTNPERVLLAEDGITVTTTYIQAVGARHPGVLIPMSTVACVYEFGNSPGVLARHAAQAWAFALFLAALYLNLTQQWVAIAMPLAFLAALVFVGSRPGSPVWKQLNAKRCVLEIGDAAGTVHSIKVSDFGVGQRVDAAIHAAMSDR
jgi:hypothetical protein